MVGKTATRRKDCRRSFDGCLFIFLAPQKATELFEICNFSFPCFKYVGGRDPSSPAINSPGQMARTNLFSPLQVSPTQDLSEELGGVGSTKGNKASRDVRPYLLNGENDVELTEENTRAWVQRTFYKNSNKEDCLGGKTWKESQKWRALDLLNKVERIKRREKSLSGYQKSASELLNITDSLSCSGPQKVALDPHNK